jgi:hypothetical protein
MLHMEQNISWHAAHWRWHSAQAALVQKLQGTVSPAPHVTQRAVAAAKLCAEGPQEAVAAAAMSTSSGLRFARQLDAPAAILAA